jgi:hypothetical protein
MKAFSILIVAALLSGSAAAQNYLAAPEIDPLAPRTATGDHGWQSMDSAPRDGTIIEIQNNYGAAPWYGIYHYGGKVSVESCPSETIATAAGTLSVTHWPCENPTIYQIDAGDSWVSENQIGSTLSPSDESRFKWRPYRAAGNYVDQTQGAQQTTGYWLRAIGR